MTKTPEQHLSTIRPTITESDIVASSVRNAERHGKTHGNAEQKIGAYLTRLDSLKAGDERTRNRLEHAVVDAFVMDKTAIPESYWKQQEQLARDNGQVVVLGDYEKKCLAEQLQDAQRTSAERWVSYLSQTGDQYPTWFQVYVLDGLSGLGIFDKKKGVFRKRSAGTVAPYPELSPAVLARVYDAAKNAKEATSFNKLYAQFLLETHTAIPTPERPEDVAGEWRHYTGNDIDGITTAAQGTPWCIAGEGMARSYTSGPEDSFYLFHLQEKDTGRVSPTAAASIRMERGKVAEISGLEGGSSQYLEDALVPTVQEKVRSLPGGEKYLLAFDDKQQLIAMDKKFQAGEDFTLEELRFLYELDRKIQYVDTYSNDPRVEEFKGSKVTHRKQLAAVYGEANAAWMVMESLDIAQNLDQFLAAGVKPDLLVSKLRPWVIAQNFDKFLAAGADNRWLVSVLGPVIIANNLNELLAAGAIVNVDELVLRLRSEDVWWKIDELLAAGVTPDVLVSKLSVYTIVSHLNKLIAAGAAINVDELVLKVGSSNSRLVEDSLDELLAAGATPDLLVPMLRPIVRVDGLNKLLAAGATIDIDELVSELGPETTAYRLSQLLAAGATIDVDALVSRLKPWDIVENLEQLLAAGASRELLEHKIGHPIEKARHLF